MINLPKPLLEDIPSTGLVTMNNVNTELGRVSGAAIAMDDTQLRRLANVGGAGTPVGMNQVRGKAALIGVCGSTGGNPAAIIIGWSAAFTGASIQRQTLGGFPLVQVSFNNAAQGAAQDTLTVVLSGVVTLPYTAATIYGTAAGSPNVYTSFTRTDNGATTTYSGVPVQASPACTFGAAFEVYFR